MSDSVIEYGRMTPDEFVDHCIDENGLAGFIDTQQANNPRPRDEWDWNVIAVHLQGFSRGYLTFTPAYLRDLYEMQRERLSLEFVKEHEAA